MAAFRIPARIFLGFRLAAVLAVLLCLEAVASAQTQTVDDVRKTARVHVGPLYLTPTVQLTELGFDTNVFNTSIDQKSDFTFTVTPKADIWVPVARRGLLTSTVGAGLVYYATYASERSVDPQFTIRQDVFFNRFTLFASNAFLNTRERPNYEIDVRSRHVENNFEAGADVRLSPKVVVGASWRRFDTKYDADAVYYNTSLQKVLNRKTTGFQINPRYNLTPLTTLALRYDNLADRFELSPGRDADSYRIMPGVEFKPRALIKGTAYVGYRKFTPVHPEALPEFSGLVAQLGLSYTLLGANSLGISFRRDLTYSWEELQPFFVDTSVGVSGRRALGRRFELILSADRHAYAYQNALIDPVTGRPLPAINRRVDTTWAYAVGMGYRLAKGGRVAFGVSWWDRTSNIGNIRDYDKLRIGTTVNYGF